MWRTLVAQMLGRDHLICLGLGAAAGALALIAIRRLRTRSPRPPRPRGEHTATRRLGGSDVDVTVLGMGGASLGDLYTQISDADAAAALLAAHANGVTFFDTAPWYGVGLSEVRFGLTLHRLPRDSFVLNTKVDFGGPQLAWGDPKTKKISSQVRLGECKCVRYGQQSETLQSFTFNPHSAWLCFSVETAAGRTFDFAATNEADAHTWVCGISALLGAEMEHGFLLWSALEMKMKEDLSQAGLPGMVKRVAQRLQLEGETGELNVAREAEKATIMRELARENAAREAAAVMTRGVTTSPPPPQQQQQPPPPQPAKSAPLPAQPPQQQQTPQPAISDPSLPRMPHPPRPPDGGKDDEEYSEYSEYSEYDGKQLAYEERLLDYEEALLERDEKAGVTGA